MDGNKFIALIKDTLGFEMVTLRKVERAVYGVETSKGRVEGLGEDASPEAILAKYDELGGLVRKNGYKVKQGLFFNRKTKQPIIPEKVILLVRVNGEYVEWKEGEAESLEMQISKKQFEEKSQKPRGRPKKA